MSLGITISVEYQVIRSMQYHRIHLVLVTFHPLLQTILIFSSCMEIKTVLLKCEKERLFLLVLPGKE